MDRHRSNIDQQLLTTPPKTNQQKNRIKYWTKINQQIIKIQPRKGSGRILASKRVLGCVWGGSWAILMANMAPSWLPKIEPQSIKTRCTTRSKYRCLSRSSFDATWVNFWKENGAKSRNKLGFRWFWGLGVEVGSKNRSKVDQIVRSAWEGTLASIFDGFWLMFLIELGWKIEPRSKIKQQSIQKCIEQIIGNKSVLEARGGESVDGAWRGGDLGTPKLTILKANQTREHN